MQIVYRFSKVVPKLNCACHIINTIFFSSFRGRRKPITKASNNEFIPVGENAYASLSREASQTSHILPTDAYLRKVNPAELSHQTALNLKAPEGLLEELQSVKGRKKYSPDNYQPKFPTYGKKDSDYDLSTFSSILIPITQGENNEKGFGKDFFQVKSGLHFATI